MSDVLWELHDVGLTSGGKTRLEQVTLQLTTGVTAVVGWSGMGKTSLLNLLVGYEAPTSGTLQRCWPVQPDRAACGWSPASFGLWPHLTVREHLLAVTTADATKTVEDALAAFDLSEAAGQYPATLSQGEKSRLSMLRACLTGSPVIVLDEPLAPVDRVRARRCWQWVRDDLKARGASLVFATHDVEVVRREASRVVAITSGQVSFHGPVDELYDRPATPEAASLLGPFNWVQDDSTAVESSGGAVAGKCLRPEQCVLIEREESPWELVETRDCGSYEESRVSNQREGGEAFWVHGRSDKPVRVGRRVMLSVLLVLLSVFIGAGCSGAAGSTLSFARQDSWKMPPEGAVVPAPRAATADTDGSFYVLDNAGRVLHYDPAGTVIAKWWMPEYSVGKPEGILVLQDGRIAVADTHYHRVVIFDKQGAVLDEFGKLGSGPGDFLYPVALTQDADGNLYVCEYGGNDRIQKFRPDGTYLATMGASGTGKGEFQRPSGIAWRDGQLYVADAFNNRIQVFSEEGEWLGFLGGDSAAELDYPYDLARAPNGDVLVVEYRAGRLTRLDSEGRLLGRFGTTGASVGEFQTPWGLAVDGNGGILICDTGNRRLVKLD
ncbi:MAG: ATP-binding cassette domain-containing protein [Planctomycetaceae bacterium]|nr:ATP-binding cassette domain-containing protein [Planctomycetaceae bacterium]